MALLALLLCALSPIDDPPLRLLGWTGDAAALPRAGTGVELFEVWADVRWNPDAAARASRLRLELVGPGGQTASQRLGADAAGSGRRLAVNVPASWVRNLRPEAVRIELTAVDDATGRPVAGPLRGGVEAFPRPRLSRPPADPRPFGWGRPLGTADPSSRRLERPGPDGWQFVRIPPAPGRPGFFLADTEATNRQVALRLPGFDPRAGRSDEFLLEDDDQPAVGLTPKSAVDYLAALHAIDPDGPAFRLPTRPEWLDAARGGMDSPFWWGADLDSPRVNWLGPEPPMANDSTARARPREDEAGVAYRSNPLGLFHTFGNAEEWAVDPPGGFVRLGGHFRTERAAHPAGWRTADPGRIGPDAYVGVRPAYSISAEEGASRIRKAFAGESGLASVRVLFDPDRATATFTGAADDAADRRLADAKVARFWWVGAVENRIETPTFAPGQLAILGPKLGTIARASPLGRTQLSVPLSVRWGDRLPVAGSEWWVNVFTPGGGRDAHRMLEGEPDDRGRVVVLVERGKLAGLLAGSPVSTRVVLSLGGPASAVDGPNVVSNPAVVDWSLP